MTKEALLQKLEELDNKFGIYASDVKELIDVLFEQNVVIPKGSNRHPYADVLHVWIEDAVIEFEDDRGYWFQENSPSYYWRHKLRIKPKEPVYEWQYVFILDGLDNTLTEYLTDEEADSINGIGAKIKIEETKRERK
jgi:hypothetical protein